LYCQVTGVPVVDREKHLVGVVSKKDLEKPGVRSNLILFISASPAIAAEESTNKLWVVRCCSAISPAVTLFLVGCEAMTYFGVCYLACG
jgi:CBS-domain-containing membrane protein